MSPASAVYEGWVSHRRRRPVEHQFRYRIFMPLFDLDERRQMIEEALAHLDNVEVMSFAKLVVDVAKEIGADFIIKGLRSTIDFESEISQAQVNLNVSGVHTLFLPSASANSAVASKYIRDIARFGGDVSSMVPAAVAKRLAEKYGD